MRIRPFRQVDVFGSDPYTGNPVAVVADADDLTDAEMARISTWTNLSECTFLVSPTDPAADYRVRIFSLERELPFAGHPTLGTARAWLDAGGRPRDESLIVQECPAGLIPVRRSGRDGEELAFATPPILRGGEVDPVDLTALAETLGIRPVDIVDARWIDNGPGWVGVLLADADAVLALRPVRAASGPHDIGVIGPHPAGSDAAYEVRGFFVTGGQLREDPVTGSLNASAAEWMLETGRVTAPFTARQGTALGRAGRIRVSEADGRLWIGGRTHVAVRGEIEA